MDGKTDERGARPNEAAGPSWRDRGASSTNGGRSGPVTLRLIEESTGWLPVLQEPSREDRLDDAGLRLPRLKRVLHRPLDGASEKEIAFHLELTRTA